MNEWVSVDHKQIESKKEKKTRKENAQCIFVHESVCVRVFGYHAISKRDKQAEQQNLLTL